MSTTTPAACAAEPVELVKCETVDLEVPATAEFVIEGVFRPDVPTDIIGWHSNSVGYYDKHQIFPIFDVTCITHRKDPLWYATIEMMPPFDHNYHGAVAGGRRTAGRPAAQDPRGAGCGRDAEHDLHRAAQRGRRQQAAPGVRQVRAACRLGRCRALGRARRRCWWWSGPTSTRTICSSVEWADPDAGAAATAISSSIESGQAFVLDPSAPKGPQGFPTTSEQMGIDATIKVPERFQRLRGGQPGGSRAGRGHRDEAGRGNLSGCRGASAPAPVLRHDGLGT